MSTGEKRNRRRRGRRGQRGRQQQQQAPATQESIAPDAQPAAGASAPPQQREARRRDDEQQQTDRRSTRKRPRSKRGRGSKRPALGQMPQQVLKDEVRDLPATGEMTMRSLDDVSTSGGLTFGCPMLTRTRIGMPFVDGIRMPRCSMGWALHNEEEASFCMRTPDLLDCWKEHPEREAALRASQDDESENAAD